MARKFTKPKPLNPMQKEFLRQYLLCRRPSEAYTKAGYKSKNPRVDANNLLKHPLIQEAVKAAESEAQEKFEIKRDDILRELKKIAFEPIPVVDIGDMMEWDGDSVSMIPKEAMKKAAIKQIKSLKEVIGKDGSRGIALEVKDLEKLKETKMKALKLLGENVGLWKCGDPEDAGGAGAGSGTGADARKALLERVRAIMRKPRE